MNILLYLLILILGAIIGLKGKLKGNIKNRIATVQNLALLFLLFIMGVKIGLEKEILLSLNTIGFQGLILALFSIIFSVLGVKLVSATILKKNKEVEVNDL
ncbi:LysO family transporter [Alkaliphilus serpentinus]|uniref:Lysine exporter LysO family protein n=1 Tax=Alkaliphilus serpentinus TaxID=1482731 RepID=A0A833HMF8_9FIRM|nr:LysO family transporter [Alkaliphilus serpentinus]KAB3527615.1 lysine exporter LysO family protein [Alkaliphilus serpentinus]